MCKNGAVNSDFIKAGYFLKKKHEITKGTRAEDMQIIYLGIYKHK
jgi:hypothetical protein